MNKLRFSFIITLLATIALVSCVSQQVLPIQRLNYMYAVYNAQYADYLDMASLDENLTDTQRDILRAKKAVLKEVYPIIMLYDASVMAGSPDAEKEQQIYSLLNRLQSLATK